MRKVLLVLLVGMVLAMDICGIITEIINNKEEIEVVRKSVTVVHVE